MSTSTAKAQAVDPVTVEIIRNGLLAVTEEMKTNLTRTAYNLIIYEALDFTVGLLRPMATPFRSASGCRCSSAECRRRSRQKLNIMVCLTLNLATSW